MRAYVPITLDALATTPLQLPTKWDVPAGVVHFVTPQLRAEFPDADEEELEWEAFNGATDDSFALALQNTGAIPRRAVLSVDIPDRAATPVIGTNNSVASRGQTSGVSGAEVAALHIDEADVASVIAAARTGGALSKRQQTALDDAHLLWYHPAEIPQLLKDVHASPPDG